ncbi:MAG: glutamate--tRNA ligase [Synergistales bacterium]|nr:glutamate--tRNA ligase [Dethiosulfovibrio sp.]NCC96476.1 glutamate--tRNA ligase [Synergistales bacterium]
MKKTRVRFAPSPTGALHIGGAHTALFNWLWARHTGGSFILRIEDTDRARSTQEYEKTIMDGMKWMNLDWDEGPDVGGEYGPYRQADRLDLYRKYAEELLEKGKAYRDGDAIIFKVPLGEDIGFQDIVYGSIDVVSDSLKDGRTGEMKDIVLIKSDGMPTYNFAVVVDDHLMEISHVIRGEDHISNTPKQVLLYKALGWELPEFAHLPMILGKDKKKLSKRHGATSVYEYRDMGYMPNSVFNFLALLGWAPAGDREIFDRDLAVAEFELKNVNRKPSVLDLDKLNFVNQGHLHALPVEEKISMLQPFWEEEGVDLSKLEIGYMEKAFEMMGGRGRTVKDLAEFTDYFLDFSPVTKRYKGDVDDDTRKKLQGFFSGLLGLEDWTAPSMEAFAREWTESNEVKLKDVAMPMRFAITGHKVSPGIFELAEFFGKDEIRKRLEHFNFV